MTCGCNTSRGCQALPSVPVGRGMFPTTATLPPSGISKGHPPSLPVGFSGPLGYGYGVRTGFNDNLPPPPRGFNPYGVVPSAALITQAHNSVFPQDNIWITLPASTAKNLLKYITDSHCYNFQAQDFQAGTYIRPQMMMFLNNLEILYGQPFTTPMPINDQPSGVATSLADNTTINYVLQGVPLKAVAWKGQIWTYGNTNGYRIDQWGWMLQSLYNSSLTINPSVASFLSQDCENGGITPPSFWEYVGKPLAIMAATVTGAALLGYAGTAAAAPGAGAGAGGLASTSIGYTSTQVAAPSLISIGSTAPITTGTLATIGDVGSVVGAGSSLLGTTATVIGTGAKVVSTGLSVAGTLKALNSPPLSGITPLSQTPGATPVKTGTSAVPLLIIGGLAAGLFAFAHFA